MNSDAAGSHVCSSSNRKPLKSIREVNQEYQRQRANRTEPPAWIVRKLAVLITLGLITFATYVYVGRACAPMIRGNTGALGDGRGMGIPFLVLFWVLWMMMMWTYVTVLITSPGYARDYVKKSPPPITHDAANGARGLSSREWDGDSCNSVEPDSLQGPERDPEFRTSSPAITPRANLESEPSQSRRASTTPQAAGLNGSAAPLAPEEAHEVHSFPPIAAVAAATAVGSSDLPPPLDSRQPPRDPILAPEYRYCKRDGFLKPSRTHHCRICATCVLNYDHHCPWIGGCVGARNRKFFLTFCFWACIFCTWVFVTLVVINTQANGSFQSADPLQIVIIALSGVFGVFTGGLVLSHTRLLIYNLSTIESYKIQAMRRREEYTLSKLHPWYAIGAKHRTVRKWDEEWGGLYTEGNIWWLGSARRNWEQVMGKHPLYWFFPIGQGEADGLAYDINPRFTADGRWRRRSQWDESLR